MNVSIRHVVYELNPVMGSKSHLALKKVQFNRFQSNSFDSEEEAIEALIKDERSYEEFVILKEIFILK